MGMGQRGERLMLHRFRDRFGTAGLAIAIVALVAALAGTAVAASGALTGKQKKKIRKDRQEVRRQAWRTWRNRTGWAGGCSGRQGRYRRCRSPGSPGKDGEDGEPGEPGEPGPTCPSGSCLLPEGATETGVWSFRTKGVTEPWVSFYLPAPAQRRTGIPLSDRSGTGAGCGDGQGMPGRAATWKVACRPKPIREPFACPEAPGQPTVDIEPAGFLR